MTQDNGNSQDVQERIGVYVCHCGTNIAGTVDVQQVAEWAATRLKRRGVVIGRDYKFMCSSLGQELIENDIKELGLTRVVVAACSPHLHEATFRTACQRAGLNPYLCELVSIREQVSWVHTDKVAATVKSQAVVSGGVERVLRHEPLEPLRVPIHPATLVVGGGIAGIQSALEIADAGYRVYLVEREPSIGGHMAQFDKTFPTLDCSACILTPRMVQAGSHPNITLLTYSEVEKVDGYVGNFVVTIRKKARKIKEDLCTGCGICQEKCPVKIIDDVYEAGLGYRKVVYTPFPQAVPKFPVMDVENCTYFKKGTCKACEKFCPTNAIDFNQQDEVFSVEVGNIVLATGYDLFDARRVTNYGYGRLPNVFTSLEFERLSNAAGPTNGSIVLRDGKTVPKAVGIIHCVGSRDRNFNNYCSTICCMQGLKFAHLVHERTGATVYNFYIDMRTAYKAYDEFYQRVLEEGTLFVRGKVAEVTDVPRIKDEEGHLIIQCEDTLAGKQRRIPVDMVILSIGLQPRADAKETAKKFGLSCSADGWFIEKHPKLDPVATMTEGVYIAGCAQGPKDIPSSVAQGAAAAARVLGKIQQREMALEPVRASINQDQCSGCRICNNLCPFNAILFHDDRMVSEINPALCQGCGTCVAACPAGAISGTAFSNEQIMAQIEGLMLLNVGEEITL
ncbi:MAG: heterodisulfide reductase subunit A [Anaerolineaceae bacterium]|nr:CoB--CoM heterodisulfide reductase iron-sulfur subunit A family protein [Anaerolineae bacterium]MBL1172073.1 CoB--CoM heterodisulfide reductase iron-sulfur subunit A family protein [Chloroflexota bacterium]MDL1926995.1 CoB--CoM heterodisulfide reductase iron-sulfur subunit A family protein [Anaerolineae bacterium AMX1]WKZ54897.1 MAG: CoB--CoM heterodisulfide reductase iron-sulfur subunit A family protein [Anaerolineales bacterium]GJQ37792.1 MAG: heterodisulfide reductase subunit A [Anaerolin